MSDQLEKDLVECLSLISPDWRMQNNYFDRRTNFIYSTESLKDCLDKIEQFGVDKEYTLHRWYNYMTSVKSEYIFCEFGAVHEKDVRDHNKDIYIKDIPYDVKLTVYPAKLKDHPYDLETREGKNQLIKWFYENQSQQNRKQLLNRIYIVCDGKDQAERLKMKSDFALLRTKISEFMKTTGNLNKIDIVDEGKTFTLYSDIVYIKY